MQTRTLDSAKSSGRTKAATAVALMPRREFLSLAAMGAMGAALGGCRSPGGASMVGFETRGLVILPEDLSLCDWPDRAAQAGLNTIALHRGDSPQAVVRFIQLDAGQDFLGRCRRHGLRVEYELHAMKELLPRSLFATEPGLFRMDDRGRRTKSSNCCVHSARALEVIAENAIALDRVLRPTTGRYFLWGDDGQPWCRCPQCRGFSDSEQALLLENHLVRELQRHVNPRAQLAHLAYANTITTPRQVKPAPGVFLEFAPI